MKVGGLRVKFVKVCEWFDGCDRLQIIFKSKKNKITDNAVVDAFKLILLNYSNFSIAKIIVKKIERVK